jgi:hypothetical protein
MAQRKFNKKEEVVIRAKIVELSLKGYRQAEIGAELGISQQTVSYHLKRCWEDLNNRTFTSLQDKRAEEDARLDLLMRRIWESADTTKCPASRLKFYTALSDILAKKIQLWHLNKIPPVQERDSELANLSEEQLFSKLTRLLQRCAPSEADPSIGSAVDQIESESDIFIAEEMSQGSSHIPIECSIDGTQDKTLESLEKTLHASVDKSLTNKKQKRGKGLPDRASNDHASNMPSTSSRTRSCRSA